MAQHDGVGVWMWLVIASKAITAVLLLGAAILLIKAGSQQPSDVFSNFVAALFKGNPPGIAIAFVVDKTMGLSPDKALRLAAATLGYGVLEAIEATGLACQRRWAEWLTVLVTASLLPFEVYELVRQPTVVKVAMLAINVAVLAYLVARRLNGHHRPHRHSWQLSLARSV